MQYPPYIQKNIVFNILKTSHQALFTTHSPYVLEEFPPENIIILSNNAGTMNARTASLPPKVKFKTYREEIRKKFFEALLSKRVLITEGRTEYDVYFSAARRLEEIDPDKYLSFDRLGIAVVSADTDSQVAPYGNYFRSVGKKVYAVFDKQDESQHTDIFSSVDRPYEVEEHGMENVFLNGVPEQKLRDYAKNLEESGSWNSAFRNAEPISNLPFEEFKRHLLKYLKKYKGDGVLAELVSTCSEAEIPVFIRSVIADLTKEITRNTEEIVDDST